MLNRAAASCSTLLPDAWREPVAGAPLPAGETVGEWVAFGDAQTGRLDLANDRTRATREIVERCETRDREAEAKLTPRRKWLGLF